jgi:hypothetical protein
MRYLRAEVVWMPIFKRVKIQATVETEAMLLQDDQIESAVGELRDRLRHLDLDVVSVEATEMPPTQPPEPTADDPWSIRGLPVE